MRVDGNIMFEKRKLDSVVNEKHRWERETLAKTLARFPERLSEFTTVSGMPIERLYTPVDVEGLDYVKDLGFPGEFPFTRGVYPTVYRGRLWTMRQYAGFGTAEESNQRYKYLIEQGQTGLSVAFDLPTQIGYDSDHPMAEGEVGKVGVPISSLRDMEILFDGIPLDKISTSMTINATAPQILAMYFAVAEKQGVPLSNVDGTVQNDVLKEYVSRGTYIYPPDASMRLSIDIIEFCRKSAPRFNTISISGYHMREAGATAVQELAFTLMNGIAYVAAALNRGMPIDDFAPRVSFFFACHNDFFEEIAKFRAARRLWAKIVKERFGAKDPRSMLLRYHVQTSGCTLTAQQPYNNIVRVTIQSLAAVLGGTQSLHTNSFDEALALPSETAVVTALRTQQIIAHESGVTNTVDPLGGSYFVEHLTNRIEEEATAYIERIDALGGAMAAIQKGFYQKEIADSAYKYQREVESKKRIVVGVNEYITEAKAPIKLLKVDPRAEEKQVERLRKGKQERDARKVKEALEKLQKAAEGDENLMPFIFEAVKAYATNGEISDTLRHVFGEYKAMTIV
ncbi:MAG: methylmalonyl-CoA mutase [Candidatus Bathyarchaeota archaeon BA1]|nr:MAG: methylmalonyl-CoA mutase [Candidatus Bathyarchaeota archaeon BA1]